MTVEQYRETCILYYADYLSLCNRYHPVTDSCKYFFIYGMPVYISYIVKQEPQYDINDPYFIQAFREYEQISKEFGEEGFVEFVNDLCNIRAAGVVDAQMMLNARFYYNSKQERKYIQKVYNEWKNNQTYQMTTITEDGDEQKIQCTKYIYHDQQRNKKSNNT